MVFEQLAHASMATRKLKFPPDGSTVLTLCRGTDDGSHELGAARFEEARRLAEGLESAPRSLGEFLHEPSALTRDQAIGEISAERPLWEIETDRLHCRERRSTFGTFNKPRGGYFHPLRSQEEGGCSAPDQAVGALLVAAHQRGGGEGQLRGPPLRSRWGTRPDPSSPRSPSDLTTRHTL